MSAATSTRDILIQSDRPEEARAFYEKGLGFALFSDDPAMYGLETGAFRLFIDTGPPLGPVLEFLVDDVEAAKARLLALGCVVAQEDASVPRCYVRDPFGLVFNLGWREG